MVKAIYDAVGGKARRVRQLYGVECVGVGASKNLLPVYPIDIIAADGVSCARNDDGSIHVSGTAAADNKFYILNPQNRCQLPGGTYTLSMGVEFTDGIRVIFEYYNETGSNWLGNYGALSWADASRTVEISAGHSLSIYLAVPAGVTVDMTLYPQLEAGSEATGYVPYGEEKRSITRRIGKSYDVVGGVTKLVYAAKLLDYDGEYSVTQVEYEGKTCDLYTITGSGLLTMYSDALVWLCGGGGGSKSLTYEHAAYNDNDGYAVGGGGGGYVNSGELSSGVYAVSIGSGTDSGRGGTTSIGSMFTAQGGASATNTNGAAGGSGGGNARNGSGDGDYGTAGNGAGISTYPFDIVSLKAHCAGGGGGTPGNHGSGNSVYSGGNGGTNGSNGSRGEFHSTGLILGYGGSYGGGNGGIQTSGKGSDAVFYGSGGGGASAGYYYDPTGYTPFWGTGGKGYQGVIYILDVNGGVGA